MSGSGRWLRDARRAMARLPSLRLSRVPDAPALPVRDPWPGDATRGARLLKGELEIGGGVRPLKPGAWADTDGPAPLRAAAHGFTWLRDLRALGTPAALLRARALVADWIATPPAEKLVHRPDVAGARIAAWLGHYDFIAASGDDVFRQKLMARLVSDARGLAAALPAEELDARALTALKGLIAAAVALPDHAAFLTRALRFLPQEIARQVLPDGCHAERSPAAHLAALQDLTEIRSLLQAAQVQLPAALPGAIDRMGPALRVLRHGDGSLALFNGSKEESPHLVEMVLSQCARGGRALDGARRWRVPAPASRPQRADRGLRRTARRRHRPAVSCRHAVDGAVGRQGPDDRQLRRLSVGRHRVAGRGARHRRALHPGDRRYQFARN